MSTILRIMILEFELHRGEAAEVSMPMRVEIFIARTRTIKNILKLMKARPAWIRWTLLESMETLK